MAKFQVEIREPFYRGLLARAEQEGRKDWKVLASELLTAEIYETKLLNEQLWDQLTHYGWLR